MTIPASALVEGAEFAVHERRCGVLGSQRYRVLRVWMGGPNAEIRCAHMQRLEFFPNDGESK